MTSPLVVQRRPPRPQSAERTAVKQALWSFTIYSGAPRPSRLPAELAPIPLADATDLAETWQDEHARQRRARALRRFRPDVFRAAKSKQKANGENDEPTDPVARVRQCDRDERAQRMPRDIHRLARATQGDAQADADDWRKCIPSTDDPTYDPHRGSSRIYSTLTVGRPMNRELACLLDPRGWDHCSDLFEHTYEVEENGPGNYVEKETPSEHYGTSWKGLLYEFADAGPQAVENILSIDLRVHRICDDFPEFLRIPPNGYRRRGPGVQGDDDYKDHKWRCEEQTLARKAVRRLGNLCKRGICDHRVDSVEVRYRLYDCLSYRVGALTLPGSLRQNQGYFRAWSQQDGRSFIQCLKLIRFGRLTPWSVGGSYDFGEILNYSASTFLSLWIGDIEQIVPCCEQPKAFTPYGGTA